MKEAVASEDFRGKENFLKKVFLPPNLHSFKNFNEGSKRMFCFTKYLSQSPFFQKFLKREGGAGGREELFPKKFLSPPCISKPFVNPYQKLPRFGFSTRKCGSLFFLRKALVRFHPTAVFPRSSDPYRSFR